MSAGWNARQAYAGSRVDRQPAVRYGVRQHHREHPVHLPYAGRCQVESGKPTLHLRTGTSMAVRRGTISKVMIHWIAADSMARFPRGLPSAPSWVARRLHSEPCRIQRHLATTGSLRAGSREVAGDRKGRSARALRAYHRSAAYRAATEVQTSASEQIRRGSHARAPSRCRASLPSAVILQPARHPVGRTHRWRAA